MKKLHHKVLFCTISLWFKSGFISKTNLFVPIPMSNCTIPSPNVGKPKKYAFAHLAWC